MNAEIDGVGLEGAMYGLCQETHWDWIDLDDMNNLADTKGGNINAHIYSNLSAVAGAWMPCSSPPLPGVGEQQMHLREELIQKCIFARELFTYRCMIMIPRLIRDKSRCLLPSAGAAEVTCFFPADLYLDSGLISQLIPWCLLTPEWCFLFFFSLPADCHAGNLWDGAQGTHVRALSSSSPPESWIQPQNASNSLFFFFFFSCKCSKHAAVIHTLLHKTTGEGQEVKQFLDLVHDLDL